jgi:carbon monoxide dehydrogenase subunit G
MKGVHMASTLPRPDIESSIWIARPPQDIWDFVSDLSNDTQWREGVSSAQWISDPPHGVGSTGLHIIEGVGDWPWTAIALEEPHNLAWRVTGGRFEGSQGAYRIDPDGDGSRFTLETQVKRNVLMSLLMPILKGMLGRQNANDLKKLKALLETG